MSKTTLSLQQEMDKIFMFGYEDPVFVSDLIGKKRLEIAKQQTLSTIEKHLMEWVGEDVRFNGSDDCGGADSVNEVLREIRVKIKEGLKENA